jgi:hypothetical protein
MSDAHLDHLQYQQREYVAWRHVMAEMADVIADLDVERGGLHERLCNAITRWGEELAQLRLSDPDPAHAEQALRERREAYPLDVEFSD